MSDELFPKPDAPRKYKGNELRNPPPDAPLPEAWQPRKRTFVGGLSRLILLGIVFTLLVLPFTPYAGRIKRALSEVVDKARETKVVYRDVDKLVEVPVTKEVVREIVREVAAPPPPLPTTFVPRKEMDVTTLFNGITVQSKLDAQEGTFASLERLDKEAYTVEFQLKIRVPKANSTLAELSKINPSLPKILPGLEPMVSSGKVSGFYHKLYENKIASVQKSVTRLNRLLDRHNFFDCETIMELTHPGTKRKALLIQSEMDVVADGSDGDRMPVMSAGIYESDFYQPSTSYEWAKTGKTQNPLLPRWQARLESAKSEYNQKGLTKARNAELKSEMQMIEATIGQLKNRSSLIAEKDPFIVLSLLFRDYSKSEGHAPVMGDYAAVIHGDKIYPAICGDYGPSMKMGEASLMLAKQINEKSTPYIRPESDLKVSYLIFPGTSEKPFGPPNLAKWQEKVAGYLKECGGLGAGYTLHTWEDPFPKPPVTTPAPTVPATPPVTPVDPNAPVTTTPAAVTTMPAIPGVPAPAAPATPGAPPVTVPAESIPALKTNP